MKFVKIIILPFFIFTIIITSCIIFLYFLEKVDLSFPLKAGIFTGIVILLSLSLVILIFSVYHYTVNRYNINSNIYYKKCEIFEKFYDLLYEYSYDQIISCEILKKLKKEFTLLSFYISDKAIKLLNNFFYQNQEKEKDLFLTKKELKKKQITFEECILTLRQELGIFRKNNRVVKELNKSKDIFEILEVEWFEWSRNRVWFIEVARDFGMNAFLLMKKHNLIFTGGGPKGSTANIVKQIKKDDIILAHKNKEGYIGVGVVTVDNKTVIWHKDNPLFYTDGEIRIPLRWLLTLNIGVDAGYVPKGLITRIMIPDRSIKILEAMINRAKESGNEYNENELEAIIKNIKQLTRIDKLRKF